MNHTPDQIPYDGSRFKDCGTIGGCRVTLGCISPEAGDLLDRIMEAYTDQYDPSVHTSSPEHVYQFAYWLCRYSGLIQPAATAKAEGKS